MSNKTVQQKATDRGARGVGKALRRAQDGIRKVPGLSTNPATNLLIADIAVRSASTLFRRTMEKGLLRARFDRETARDIVQGRSAKQSLASFMVARTATRSLPGFLVVAAGLAGKAILDRGLARGEAEARGLQTLEDMADNAGDES